MMRLLKNQLGLSLIELTLTLAITGLVAVPLTAIIGAQLRIPAKIFRDVAATRQTQNSGEIIVGDARAAQSFVPGDASKLEYGTFSWFEFSGTSPVPVSARYFWEDEKLMRVLDHGGNVSAPLVVLGDVVDYSDIDFDFDAPKRLFNPVAKTDNYINGKLNVSITRKREGTKQLKDIVDTQELVANIRSLGGLEPSRPGRLAPPEEEFNQVSFRVSATPLITTGKHNGGSSGSLAFDDTLFLDVDGAQSPDTVIWEATSEPIDFDSITSITVQFTGQVDKAGVTEDFFIYNPDDHEIPDVTVEGYSDSPDVTTLYTSPNLDRTVTFEFSEDDVEYVDDLTTKVAKVKMRATHAGKFKHRADQLVFIVTGEPSSPFSRDFLLESDPAMEAGDFKSGNFNSLTNDDTDYFVVKELSGVVQWSVVTEPITLEPISSIEVVFTARVTDGAPVQEIFVFNPANGGDGYTAVPDSQITYAARNTDTTVSFFLSVEDLAYVNALFPKEVRVRVKATDPAGEWKLEADQLIFRVRQ